MSSTKWVALTVLVAAITVAVACGGDSDDGTSAGLPQARGETETNPVLPNLPLDISDVQKGQALREIKDYGEVVDATLSQSGLTVTLDLVVVSTVSEERAKELGEQFVRIVKRRGPDHRPVNQIGTGSLDYAIAVSNPDAESIAKGDKIRAATKVIWE